MCTHAVATTGAGRESCGATTNSALAAANEKVVVAPHDSLPAPVVATAWLHKMLCEDADANALASFAGSYTTKAPGEH